MPNDRPPIRLPEDTDRAAMMLWSVAGLLIVFGGLGIIWMGVAHDTSEVGDNQTGMDRAIALRNVIVLVTGLLTPLFILGAIGVQLATSWGRVMGMIASVFAILLIPVGTGQGITSLVLLARGAGRRA